MNPIRSSLGRALRPFSHVSCSQGLGVTTRTIASTTRNGTQINQQLYQQQEREAQHFNLRGSHPPLATTTSSTPRIATTTPNPFQALLTTLTTTLITHSTPPLPHLTTLLQSYTSNPSDWTPYAHGNAAKQYTRNLVCEIPGLFNLLLLVWTPGKRSAVHDHARAHCLMRVLRGGLVERRFGFPAANGRLEGKKLREIGKTHFKEGQVGYISDDLGLHEISNPSQMEFAVSLHLYTPPNAAITGCHLYNEENGEARHVLPGVYDSINGIPTSTLE